MGVCERVAASFVRSSRRLRVWGATLAEWSFAHVAALMNSMRIARRVIHALPAPRLAACFVDVEALEKMRGRKLRPGKDAVRFGPSLVEGRRRFARIVNGPSEAGLND